MSLFPFTFHRTWLYIDIMQKSLFRWAGAVIIIAATPALAVTIDNASGNPYQGIVDRNVFGLRPPPPPPDPELNKPPPPKITLTGITTILGNARALMKSPPPPGKPGEPAKGEQYYTLSVGQREGEVEVLEIDPVAGSVKINNSGSVVTLTFDKDTAKGGAGGGVPAPPGAVPPPMPGAGGFGAAAPAGGPTGFSMPTRTVRPAGGFGQPAGSGADASGAPGAQPAGFGSTTAGGFTGAQPANTMQPGAIPQPVQTRSVEENVLLSEAMNLQRDQARAAGAKVPHFPQHPMLQGAPGQQPPAPPQ
jgi:hypothetical protein